MVNARRWLSKEEVATVEAAVRQAEMATACEFVCAVASRSSAYPRATTLFTLLGSVLGFLVAGIIATWSSELGSWEVVYHVDTHWSLLGIVSGFMAGWWVAARSALGFRAVCRPAEIAQTVEAAAWTLFGHHKVSHTEAGVGVLIYLSLQERRLTVLADRGAYRVLGDAGLAALRDLGVAQLAQGKKAEAFIEVLQSASTRLQETFPYHEADRNELADHVLFVHPFPRGV